MSRRHTARTLEHPPAQADPADRVVEHYEAAGIPIWYATRMPEPWEGYYWHQWQHAWAEYTLTVVEAVWRNTGARLYATHRDHDLRDDLHSWLLVKAVEVGKDLQPDPWHPAPERQYGKRLYEVLKHRARYHFADVVGSTDHPSGLAAREARRRLGPSVDAQQQAQEGDDTAVILNQHAIWGRAFEEADPADVVIRLESLEREADKIEREDRRSSSLHPGIAYTSASGTCMVNLCQRPTSKRGLCHKHYAQERQHAIDRGDWQPLIPKEGCKVDGCNRPHGSRGYCNTHYERLRTTGSVELQERPQVACSHEDCDRPAKSKGMCHRHYEAARRATLLPCSVEGCTTRAAGRGMCDTHLRQWRKARAAGEGEAYPT